MLNTNQFLTTELQTKNYLKQTKMKTYAKTLEKMTRKEKIKKFLSELETETEIDILDCIDVENVNDYSDIYDQIEENGGFDIDIIYYANAMKYLSEHDISLRESMSLVSSMGLECSNINSEVLASLLASQQAEEDFQELESEIDDFFMELDKDQIL
jgi:hypothetical protein